MEEVRCSACGDLISDKYDLFNKLREIKTFEHYKKLNVDVRTLPLIDERLDCSDIYEFLDIPKEKYCCRMKLSVAIIFNEYTQNSIQGTMSGA